MSSPAQPYKVQLFCPKCGSSDKIWESEVVGICRRCGFIDFVNAKPAAVAIIVDPSQAFVTVRRKRNPGAGKIGLIGGFVEPWETAEAAVARETFEETKLVISSVRYLTTLSNRYEYQGLINAILDLYFIAQVEDFHAEACPSEVMEIVHLPPTELSPEAFAFPAHYQALQFYLQQRSADQ